MTLLMSPGLWQVGLNGLSGVNWGALMPMLDGADHFDRAPGLVRHAELQVLSAYRKKASVERESAAQIAQIRNTDPKAANIQNYDLIDPATEVFLNG